MLHLSHAIYLSYTHLLPAPQIFPPVHYTYSLHLYLLYVSIPASNVAFILRPDISVSNNASYVNVINGTLAYWFQTLGDVSSCLSVSVRSFHGSVYLWQ
jgi:hypothetical protein